MSTTTATAAPPAAWSLPRNDDLLLSLANAQSVHEITDLLDAHNMGPREYRRGRLSLMHANEGLDDKTLWVAQRIIERTIGRPLTTTEALDLRQQVWQGLRILTRQLEREHNQTSLFTGSRRLQLGTARFVADEPHRAGMTSNPEVDNLAAQTYVGELAEHELRMALAADQWS